MAQEADSPSYDDLKNLAELRLRESEVLFDNQMYDGCAYLSGYAVELGLKAIVCKNLNVETYPAIGKNKSAFATHQFDVLLLFAGLSAHMNVATADAALLANWSIATAWGPDRRYSKSGTHSKEAALSLLEAIRHADDGVFTWIKGYW